MKRDVKARKKWTKEETSNLLFGVSKHGVGRWTNILEDRSFSFHNRSRVDFEENSVRLNYAKRVGRARPLHNTRKAARVTGGIRESPDPVLCWRIFSLMKTRPKSTVGPRRLLQPANLTKAELIGRKLEDLAQLGIERPFRESQRRERKPFLDQDNRKILMGYDLYGLHRREYREILDFNCRTGSRPI